MSVSGLVVAVEVDNFDYWYVVELYLCPDGCHSDHPSEHWEVSLKDKKYHNIGAFMPIYMLFQDI
jgi:hypothetical protein